MRKLFGDLLLWLAVKHLDHLLHRLSPSFDCIPAKRGPLMNIQEPKNTKRLSCYHLLIVCVECDGSSSLRREYEPFIFCHVDRLHWQFIDHLPG